ncbi:hypothetical protein AIZ13_18330 [Salmonella enterica subsp. enterica serovar Typhimurium]|uniref:hypothetical protein n=1 Tax=Salmonella enterica TaxID=28901 RepID=UPI0007790BB2|nr:hypothetical protein [Salmonella enterica]EAU1490489.1 hypothetical protein [Salmonella enterica]KYF19687.1 hypothetical protein AIZ04_15880 [Salmonella enterica subsp. enterica serovar Typhimurium]KYF24174.1 hypothetical protein AIZ13_18330 [Salmonella enterica subsp. enterica serovar Typhimurium]KYI68161.1 hypothetical protein AIZ18_05405 [Salmonella enterica subsp. enterica serovar Typhimurium]KYI71340.1 hypothetical protein AIZ19_05230 [Salmonella enterica subsp. enterica serovar Typhim
MKERGMIFNGEMVRALLDGRKTQTRRIMKNQPCESARGGPVSVRNIDGGFQWFADDGDSCVFPCPFGAVGDRIWVREAFRVMGCATDVARLMYKASERNSFTESTRTVPVGECTKQPSQNWTPSIHMPRWASRILLEITDVRVERLQAITLGDICKEIGCGLYDFRPATYGFQVWEELWQSIYGEESWLANPWVWVIEFKRVEGGAA